MQNVLSLLASVLCAFAFTTTARADWVDVPDNSVVREISSSPHQPLPERISLLTWNIQKAGGENQWRRDLNKLVPGKHLVLLQEAVEEPWVVDVLKSLREFSWWMARSFFLETDRNGTGVMTGATQPPWSYVHMKSRDREPLAETPKVSLLTTYEFENGERLLVVNVHAINFTTLGPFQRQIDDLAGIIGGWRHKVIWAGDFNTWGPGRMDYLYTKAESLSLKPVRFKRDPRNLVLDHIFVRGCAILSSKVHSQIDSSDHYPLTADFSCAF